MLCIIEIVALTLMMWCRKKHNHPPVPIEDCPIGHDDNPIHEEGDDDGKRRGLRAV